MSEGRSQVELSDPCTLEPRAVWWRTARRKLEQLFGIDPRTLALFRILASLLLLCDSVRRLPDLNVFYADGGIAPVALFREHPLRHWSLHFLDGSPAFQASLFALSIFFALALLLGYRTRLATICSWVLLASLHTRMPLVGNGGDLLLRLLLFWGMFVPLGRCWSVDAALRRIRSAGRTPADDRLQRPVVSVGAAAMLVQVCSMYFFSGIYKFNADWLGDDWLGGDALLWAMSFDYFTLPPAHWLAGFPWLLQWLTLATVWLELLGPLIVFFPWQTGKIRLVMIAVFAALHLGIHLTLAVGMFSTVSMVGWTLFLPPGLWRAVRVPVFRSTTPQVVRGKQDALLHQGQQSDALLVSRLAVTVAVQLLCGTLLVYTLFQNATPLALEAMGAAPRHSASLRWMIVPKRLENFGQALTLNQTWDMFRYSPKFDGWYVARAELADGQVIDLLWDRPASDVKPELPSAAFPNEHWRYYFHYLTDNEFAKFRQPAAEFLCRRWNASHGDDQQIVRLQLLWHGEVVEPGQPPNSSQGDYVLRSLAVVRTQAADKPPSLEDILRGLDSRD